MSFRLFQIRWLITEFCLKLQSSSMDMDATLVFHIDPCIQNYIQYPRGKTAPVRLTSPAAEYCNLPNLVSCRNGGRAEPLSLGQKHECQEWSGLGMNLVAWGIPAYKNYELLIN